MMKILRFIFPTMLTLLMATWSLRADERSAELLRALELKVEQMAGYEVHFTLGSR